MYGDCDYDTRSMRQKTCIMKKSMAIGEMKLLEIKR